MMMDDEIASAFIAVVSTDQRDLDWFRRVSGRGGKWGSTRLRQEAGISLIEDRPSFSFGGSSVTT